MDFYGNDYGGKNLQKDQLIWGPRTCYKYWTGNFSSTYSYYSQTIQAIFWNTKTYFNRGLSYTRANRYSVQTYTVQSTAANIFYTLMQPNNKITYPRITKENFFFNLLILSDYNVTGRWWYGNGTHTSGDLIAGRSFSETNTITYYYYDTFTIYISNNDPIFSRLYSSFYQDITLYYYNINQ